MLKIISGGETGSDRGALLAAGAAGLATGGWASAGWETEDGPAPWLAAWGLLECPDPGEAAARWRNVRDCDAALLFGDRASAVSRALLEDCLALGRPWVHVGDVGSRRPPVVEYLRSHAEVRVLLVAGACEDTGRFLHRVFRQLGMRSG